MEQRVPTYWKFIIGLIIILVLAIGGFFVWNQYFSSEAKYARETQENYQKYLEFEANYEKALTEDTFGGKTPEETLNMFIEALKAGNVELASKYFYLDTNEKSEYYLTQGEWRDGLVRAKEEGGLEKIIERLSNIVPAGSVMEGYFGFEVRDVNNGLIVDINMKLNSYSGVWKIESM